MRGPEESDDEDLSELPGDCKYGKSFAVYHCWLAFRDGHKCRYCLCKPCWLKMCAKTEVVKGKNRTSKRAKRGQPAVEEGDVCKHILTDLRLEDKESVLARKNLAQVGKSIPYKCSSCKLRL